MSHWERASEFRETINHSSSCQAKKQAVKNAVFCLTCHKEAGLALFLTGVPVSLACLVGSPQLMAANGIDGAFPPVRPTGAGSVKSRRVLGRPCSEIRTLFTASAAFPTVRQQAAWPELSGVSILSLPFPSLGVHGCR